MVDQAHALRTLMKQRRLASDSNSVSSQSPSARVLGMTAAKGGVGKTTLALQTALTLQKAGQSVCVWDVDGNAAHDLVMGFHHPWNISHVLTGSRTASEVLYSTGDGLHYLQGNGVSNLTTALWRESSALSRALQFWEEQFDVIILDLPGAISGEVQSLMAACHSSWLVCTPEPTAVAASYGFMKSCSDLLDQTSIVVNQAETSDIAFDVIDRLQQTTKLFLQTEIRAAGFVPSDPAMTQFANHEEEGAGRKAIAHLSTRWLTGNDSSNFKHSFFQRFHHSNQSRLSSARAA
ncbi:MAG: AAA family ATPase [Planctomycetaceae bacterium]|nr:AAA family ATPase [Planctomycetaceae bacterium]